MTPADAPRAKGPGEPSPPRRAASVRRTSTIDIRWTAGLGSAMSVLGRARDLLTPIGAAPVITAEAEIKVRLSGDRAIEAISSDPHRPELNSLLGMRTGGRLRHGLSTLIPDDHDAGTPLYLLLDDLTGAVAVSASPFPFMHWPEHARAFLPVPRDASAMEGVCIGFAPGSSSLADSSIPIHSRSVAPLPGSGDPLAWHHLDDIDEVSMRRARRMDVWLDGDIVNVSAFFQDTATSPNGGREAAHEYLVAATARVSGVGLTSISAEAHVLPFAECPMATLTIGSATDIPYSELRTSIPRVFEGTKGCTHLNDVVRALADVPALVQALRS